MGDLADDVERRAEVEREEEGNVSKDGPQKRENRMEQLQREINALIQEWHMNGWDPALNWPINIFFVSTRIDCLVDVVKENLLLTDDEWDLMFGEKLLQNLKDCLEKMYEAQRNQAKPQIDVFRTIPPMDGGMN